MNYEQYGVLRHAKTARPYYAIYNHKHDARASGKRPGLQTDIANSDKNASNIPDICFSQRTAIVT